jgi:hypothetical protein
MVNSKKSFWLNYDFGLRGNYNGLFTFLDNNEAIECGNGLAYFTFSNPNKLTLDELIKKITSELAELVIPSPSDRIYLIWRDDSGTSTKVKGKFIFGDRKTAPWNGYGNKYIDKANEEAI